MVWDMVMAKEKIRQRVTKVCFILPAGAAEQPNGKPSTNRNDSYAEFP